MMPARAPQSGFALVGAIFLIVILAAIGAFAVSISGVQHATSSQSVIAARVYYGAKAGLDWGIQQSRVPACAATSTFTPAGAGLTGVTVTVTCAQQTAGAAPNAFYLVSTATYGAFGAPDFAQRTLEATVW